MGGVWIHAQGFGDQYFLNRDESLVGLAKAFAAKDLCLVFGYEQWMLGGQFVEAKIPIYYFNQSGEKA